MKCPCCNENVRERLPADPSPDGWGFDVPPTRLVYVHMDGEPLCPVMTLRGYMPALPGSEDPVERLDSAIRHVVAKRPK